MKIDNRTNLSEAEMPRELAEIASFDFWKVLRRESGKIYALAKESPRDSIFYYLRKVVYDESSRKIIEHARFKENDWSVGERIGTSFIIIGIPSLINWARPEIRERFKKTSEWNTLSEQLQESNKQEHQRYCENLSAPIRLYQGNIAEVESDLGMRLKRIDTQTPETFLKEDCAFDLRVKAAQLGANAVVHYRMQRHEDYHDITLHVGTPVKFVGSLYHSPHDIIVEESFPQAQ